MPCFSLQACCVAQNRRELYRGDITFHINARFLLKCKILREHRMHSLQSKRKKIFFFRRSIPISLSTLLFMILGSLVWLCLFKVCGSSGICMPRSEISVCITCPRAMMLRADSTKKNNNNTQNTTTTTTKTMTALKDLEVEENVTTCSFP